MINILNYGTTNKAWIVEKALAAVKLLSRFLLIVFCCCRWLLPLTLQANSFFQFVGEVNLSAVLVETSTVATLVLRKRPFGGEGISWIKRPLHKRATKIRQNFSNECLPLPESVRLLCRFVSRSPSWNVFALSFHTFTLPFFSMKLSPPR